MVKRNNRHIALQRGIKDLQKVIIVLLLLFLFKLGIGIITHTRVLIADSLHTLVDSIAIIAVYIGIKLAIRPPSKKFPYGFYKAESLASLFVSFIILYGAYDLIIDTITHWKNNIDVSLMPVAAASATLSMIVSYFISKYETKIAVFTNSEAIHTTSKESMIDVFSSFLVLLSILLSSTKFSFLEPVVTLIIVIFVIKIALENVYNSVLALMDVSPSKEKEMKITKVLKNIPFIIGYKDLKLRKSGPFIFGEVTVLIPTMFNVERIYEITEEIEKKVKKVVPQLEHFVIHVQPSQKNIVGLLFPIMENKGLDSRISPSFARADGFLIVEINVKKKKVNINTFMINPYKKKEIRAGLSIVKNLLSKEDFDIVIAKEIGDISFHTLRDHGKEIYKAVGETVGENVSLFFKKKLNKMDAPTQTKE